VSSLVSALLCRSPVDAHAPTQIALESAPREKTTFKQKQALKFCLLMHFFEIVGDDNYAGKIFS